MSIFGESSEDYINDAMNELQDSFNQAQSYESPYTEYGATDFDNARNYLYKSIGDRNDYNSNFYKYLNMSPDELLNEAMGSYTESPFAQEKSAYALSAADNAMAAQGMTGSGNNEFADAEIQNAIMGQDQEQYLHDLMKTYGVQKGLLDQYDQGTSQLMKMFQSMLHTEEGAANTLAGDSMREGQYEAMASERGAMDERGKPGPVDQVASLIGAIGALADPRSNKPKGGGSHKTMRRLGTAAAFM